MLGNGFLQSLPPVFISILIIPHLFNRGSISIPKLRRALIEIISPELSSHKPKKNKQVGSCADTVSSWAGTWPGS